MVMIAVGDLFVDIVFVDHDTAVVCAAELRAHPGGVTTPVISITCDYRSAFGQWQHSHLYIDLLLSNDVVIASHNLGATASTSRLRKDHLSGVFFSSPRRITLRLVTLFR